MKSQRYNLADSSPFRSHIVVGNEARCFGAGAENAPLRRRSIPREGSDQVVESLLVLRVVPIEHRFALDFVLRRHPLPTFNVELEGTVAYRQSGSNQHPIWKY